MSERTSNESKHAMGLFSETITFEQGDALLVNGKGPITINGVDSAKGSIAGVGNFRLAREEQQVSVHANGPTSIKSPDAIPLKLRIKGPVKVMDIDNANVTVERTAGPLVINRCASVNIRDLSGPLNISHITGDVQVDEMEGPSFFKKIAGNLTLASADGPVSANACKGDMTIASDEQVFIKLSGDRTQTIRVRSDDDVYLVTPAATRVEGDIQAGGEITVELDQQSIHKEDARITLTPSASEGPLISVDIQAEGDVYLGPNPPVTIPQAASGKKRTSGRSWGKRFLAKLGLEFTADDEEVSWQEATPAPQTPARNLHQEQEMILRMVAEGKITAEEGDQLLEALQA